MRYNADVASAFPWVVTITLSRELWHARLGHASLSCLQLLASQGHLGSIQSPKFDCTSCHFSKQTKFPFNNSDSFSSAPFDLIHFDIWGLVLVPIDTVIFLDIPEFICFTIGLNLCPFTKHIIK